MYAYLGGCTVLRGSHQADTQSFLEVGKDMPRDRTDPSNMKRAYATLGQFTSTCPGSPGSLQRHVARLHPARLVRPSRRRVVRRQPRAAGRLDARIDQTIGRLSRLWLPLVAVCQRRLLGSWHLWPRHLCGPGPASSHRHAQCLAHRHRRAFFAALATRLEAF